MCNKSHKTLYDKLCYNLKNKDDVSQFEELRKEIDKIVGNDKNKVLLLLAEAKEYTLFDGVSALCTFVNILLVFVNTYLSLILKESMLTIVKILITIMCISIICVTINILYKKYKYKHQVIEILTDMLENINYKEGI